ncbi:hypothetical protein CMV_021634 [Castanea mollissima]|uniref:Uncharacterized protein n=1 Tax=Castanea mollissima TaxID=60419 RepID=A0A8J4QFF5_9ROSI|nr:hypothetical protein CMV_021634 [Castanea mollissima]
MEVSSDWKSLSQYHQFSNLHFSSQTHHQNPYWVLSSSTLNPKPFLFSSLSPSLPNPPPFLQTHNLLSFLCLPLSLLPHRSQYRPTFSKIAVNPFPFPGNNHNHSTVVGYLLASALCSMHWFVVQESYVVYACWSPHIPEESVVLLESGALFLFDLESCFRSRTSNSNVRFRGTKLPISWDADAVSGNCKWLSCEFSWHPRILIVARSDAVFLVDLRFDGCAVSCLAKVELLRMYTSVQNERFLTFSMAGGSDGFCFALASDSLLVLCDVRKPMMPLLQWAHGLDNLCHINVFRLSELRSNSRDDTYRWAFERVFVLYWDLYGIVGLIYFVMDLLYQPREDPLFLKFRKTAYSNYSEFLDVLLDQKKVSLEFLVVPDLPQLPPFFLRKPSCHSNKWSHKVQRDDALVGPVLSNGHSESEDKAGVFSLEREISLQCDEIKQVASEMALSDSSCKLHGDQADSLADEREDMWGSSQKPKPYCIYHPVACKCSTMDHVQDNVFKDEKFDNLIFKVPEKKKHVPNGLVETVGPELFDDLCPADLRFDTSAKNFGPN